MNKVFQSFLMGSYYRDETGELVYSDWDNPTCKIITRMSLNSFFKHGHEVHLYVYHPISGIPDGVILKDANEIVPFAMNAKFRFPAQFFDYLSAQLLRQCGGWIFGTDVICLRPFDMPEPYAFAVDDIDHLYITNTVVKAPVQSKIMTDYCAAIEAMDTLHPENWASSGPILLQQEVLKFDLMPYVHLGKVFDMIPYTRITEIVDPTVKWNSDGSYCIHLRQSIWDEGPNSCAGILPSGKKIMTEESYPSESLWEQLKREYA